MPPSPRIRFGDFEADLTAGELSRLGEAVHLQDLPFRLLAALVERPGELVTRTELGQRLWGADTFVDFDAGLNTAIAKLREALGDDPETPVFVETIPKRGYRFVGRVETLPAPSANARAREHRVIARTAPGRTRSWRAAVITPLVAVAIAVGGLAAYRLVGVPSPVRVAVALFDNETGRPELERLAQTLTDSTVIELSARPHLAVIGNAAVLRTSRPFRDLEKIRDALEADYIIIGQVQQTGQDVRVLAHLIRAADQAHVWVSAVPLGAAADAALQSTVVRQVGDAVATHIPSPR